MGDARDALLRALAGPDWIEHAACRGLDPDLFHPDRGEAIQPAKQVCATCPVRQPCLDYALAMKIQHGVWGGLSERERRRIRAGHTAAPTFAETVKTPPTVKWCPDCQAHLPVACFGVAADRYDGIAPYCRDHARIRKNESVQRRRERRAAQREQGAA
jgi:WhiB family redox-sensing transcriptional regulator